jgi:phosphopantothenoylcysteine decarboxylase/phosphopantothenate--cysteine ligase
MVDLTGRRVVVGVSGGIAAYKAAELVSRLRSRGADVWVVTTKNAAEFVGAATFRALTGHPVASEMFNENIEWEMQHLSLSDFAEVVIIAPATANVIGKIAAGLGDDLLTTAVLAAECPVIIAPAMNFKMWDNPIVQGNVEKLLGLGYVIVGPEEGRLAEGTFGKGRLAGLDALVGAIETALIPAAGEGESPLAGKRVVITAGPTREAIDPVRYISNRSSGKQGYALAEGARDRGATVTLISGPSALPVPEGVRLAPVLTTADMAEAVRALAEEMDVFIAAAAPADYAPVARAEHKIKKAAETLTLELRRTEDVLAWVGSNVPACIKVGFAAETVDLAAGALGKLHEKHLDLIAANDVSRSDAGFEVDENEVVIYRADGSAREVARASKRAVAAAILDEVEGIIEAR